VSTHENSIEVDRPVHAVYDQWTQCESFPLFMEGVESVRQIDPRQMHWVTRTAGSTRSFMTEITEQVPDHLIAWKNIDGPRHTGVVTLERLDDGATKVSFRVDMEPQGFVERVSDGLGVVSQRLEGDMKRFKAFVEAQPTP
jgi:uncharacterized membrane protein